MSNALPPIRDGLLLALIPSTGSIRDHSPAQRTVQVAGSGLEWARVNGADQLRAKSTGRLVTPNDTELQAVTDFSLFCAGEIASSAAQLLYKGDAGGLQIDIYKDNGTEIEINDGVNTRVADIGPWAGVKSFCGTFESGAIGNLYRNGAWKVAFDGITTITGDNADTTLLNYYTGVSPWLGTARALLWYSRSITANENSLLNAWSESLKSPRLPFDRRYFDYGSSVPNGNVGGVVGAWDLSAVHQRSVADKSGNGNHGDLVGSVAPVLTEAGRALKFDGATGSVDLTGIAHASGSFSFSAVVNSDLPAATNRYLFDTASGRLVFTWFSSIAGKLGLYDGAFKSFGDAPIGGWHHIVFTVDSVAGEAKAYVDGVQSGSAVVYAPKAIGGATALGANNVGSGNYFEGMIRGAVLVPRVLTLSEIKADYLKLASRVMFDSCLDQVRVTLADKTSGKIGPYDIQTGTHALKESSTTGERHIENVVAGLYTRPQPLLGTHRFKFNKAAGSDLYWVFIASARAAWNDGAQDGYQLQVDNVEKVAIQVISGGVATNLFVTAVDYVVAGVDYEITITRSALGVFKAYILGGAYDAWTLVGTSAADLTHVTSVYAVTELDAGDRQYTDLQMLGEVAP